MNEENATSPSNPESSTPAVNRPTSFVEKKTNRFQPWHGLRLAALVTALLTALAVVGLAVTDAYPRAAKWYWLIVLPLFAVISVVSSPATEGYRGAAWWTVLRRHLVHWLGFVLAIKLLYLLVRLGVINWDGAGLISLILLALTCYLAGVHLDSAFLPVSFVLALGVLAGADLQRFLWLIVLVLVVAMFLLVGIQYWRHWRSPKA